MLDLARTVRVFVPLSTNEPHDPPRHNTFAGWPTTVGLGAYYEVTVTCRGEPAEPSGYVQDITLIDAAVRAQGLPVLRRAAAQTDPAPPGTIVSRMFDAIAGALNTPVTSVRLRLSPTYSVAMAQQPRDRVQITQQFEFSAAHRLHCPELSDQENRRIFGKCNNAEGHGHNYRLEVAVAVPLVADGRSGPGIGEIDRIVDEVVIQRFDHRHLNRDTAEFASLNPSVEHITRVCHDLLREPLAAAGCELQRVTVWETAKTSCTYPA